MSAAITQSLMLFALMGAGYLVGKTNILDRAAAVGLSRLLVYCTLPALILVSMQQPFTPELRDQASRVLLFSILVYASALLLAFAITRLYPPSQKQALGVHRFALCFSNVGFMGFPVAEAILGRESLFLVSIYNIPFQILAFSVGILMIAASGRTGDRRPSAATLLKNPSILAVVFGFGCFLAGIRLPGPVYHTLELLGDTTTPLAMIVIGANLAFAGRLRQLRYPALWFTTLYRLVLHPLLVFALARLLGLSGLVLAVPVLIAAMPVAANTSILASVYGGDTETASALVFISTFAALATIPLLQWLLL